MFPPASTLRVNVEFLFRTEIIKEESFGSKFPNSNLIMNSKTQSELMIHIGNIYGLTV